MATQQNSTPAPKDGEQQQQGDKSSPQQQQGGVPVFRDWAAI